MKQDFAEIVSRRNGFSPVLQAKTRAGRPTRPLPRVRTPTERISSKWGFATPTENPSKTVLFPVSQAKSRAKHPRPPFHTPTRRRTGVSPGRFCAGTTVLPGRFLDVMWFFRLCKDFPHRSNSFSLFDGEVTLQTPTPPFHTSVRFPYIRPPLNAVK